MSNEDQNPKPTTGREASAMSDLLCCACNKPADPLFMNGVDDSVMCEACAVAEYKAKHPLTWNMPVFNTESFINAKAT